MKTTTINNNLFQLTRLGFVNCYLVREDDGFTLIDTGIAGSASAILEAAKALSLPIVRIALTHAHGDHIGSLDALHQALPEAEVVISKRDARFLQGDNSLDADEVQLAKLRGSYQVCSTKPTRELVEGDRVGSLEVIASPGHTPGHVAFLDLRDRSLIAGDAFQTLGGVAVAGTVKPLFPLPAMATWHKPTALQSARKLHSLQPAFLAIGHGRVLVAPGADMEKAIATLSKEVEK
jgi:glyoxylase-like metal-dependent hydrolase (beta-lactamase superfamily II)